MSKTEGRSRPGKDEDGKCNVMSKWPELLKETVEGILALIESPECGQK